MCVCLAFCYRNLQDDLLHVIGMPSLIRPSPNIINVTAQTVLVQLQNILQDLPELEHPNAAAGFYPMDLFLSLELRTFEAVIEKVKVDVEFLLDVTRGTTPPTPTAQQRLLTLSNGETPESWFTHTGILSIHFIPSR